MEDMSESDLLPKNTIKVLEVYKQSYCQSSYGEGERGEDGRGKRRETKGERRGGVRVEGRRVHIHCIVTMSCLSLQLCEEELKN